MLDILIDLLVLFLTGKKRKKNEGEITGKPELKRNPRAGSQGVRTSSSVTQCAKCQKKLTHDAVFGAGETWCRRCYKTEVLHIRA